jgi:hypothetical protein
MGTEKKKGNYCQKDLKNKETGAIMYNDRARM